MTDLDRRATLQRLMATAVAGMLPSLSVAQSGPVSLTALAAYIDVLLPGDAALPPARDLSIAETLVRDFPDESLAMRLLQAGTVWLDSLGGAPFADLPANTQNAVATWAAQSDFNEIPGRFHYLVRQWAVSFYYADPRTYDGLALNTAPQPRGYPPPWSSG